VQRVTVFDISGKQGGAIDATIETEQTSYVLVTEDGL
jgi:hypothetical protein